MVDADGVVLGTVEYEIVNSWYGEEVEGDRYLTFQSLLLLVLHSFKKAETRSNQSSLST